MENLRVIIPAAGKGTRLQAINKDLPKAMFCVGNRPMLEIVLENTSFIDASDTYIVVGYGKEKIIEYFQDQFHYVEQIEQLGTGNAVRVCEDVFKNYEGDVLVTFGDMPLFTRNEMEKMCLQHKENKLIVH